MSNHFRRPDEGHPDTTLHVLRLFVGLSIFSAHWSEPYFPLAMPMMPQAQLAIDFFFVIEGYFSGRLLTTEGGSAGFWRSVLQRFAHVYPLYLSGLLAGVATVVPLALAREEGWSSSFAFAAASLGAGLQPIFSDVAYGAVFPFNPPSWAIALELWGFTALWLARKQLTSLTTLAIILAIAAFLMLGLAILWRDPNMGWRTQDYWGGFARMAFGFICGAVMYKVLQIKDPLLPRVHAVLVWIAFIGVQFLRVRYVALPLVTFVVPGIVWLAATASNPKWLDAFGRQAGRHAYAAYLLHYPTMAACRAAELRMGIPEWFMGSPTGYLLVLAVVLAVAHLFTRLIDEPLRSWVGGRLSANGKPESL